MKSLKSLKYSSELRVKFYEEVSENPQALADLGITREEAMRSVAFYRGELSALKEVENIIRTANKSGREEFLK